MFLNNRTDTPNLYAATRAASGTATSTTGLHVGTYKVDKMINLSKNDKEFQIPTINPIIVSNADQHKMHKEDTYMNRVF